MRSLDRTRYERSKLRDDVLYTYDLALLILWLIYFNRRTIKEYDSDDDINDGNYDSM